MAKYSSKRLRNKRRRGEDKPHLSIAFLLAIPGNFVFASVCLITLASILTLNPAQSEIWAVFATGFIGGVAVIGGSGIQRFRVLVHELKHAIVVLLSGNKLRDIEVGKQTGHVEYAMYDDRLHFAPIIALAPYFFPIFSLPALGLCIALDEQRVFLALALGITLAADTSMAYSDLGPHQSDLKKIPGGLLAALTYLASAHFLWFMICLLWVSAGRKAYFELMYVVAEFAGQIARRISG